MSRDKEAPEMLAEQEQHISNEEFHLMDSLWLKHITMVSKRFTTCIVYRNCTHPSVCIPQKTIYDDLRKSCPDYDDANLERLFSAYVYGFKSVVSMFVFDRYRLEGAIKCIHTIDCDDIANSGGCKRLFVIHMTPLTVHESTVENH